MMAGEKLRAVKGPGMHGEQKMEKYVDLFKSILEVKNPKFVLNHIYFDEENMVATNTRILLIHKHGMEIDTPFIAVNPKVKVDGYNLNKEKSLGSIQMLKEEWNKVMPEKVGPALVYPNYERIDVKEINKGLMEGKAALNIEPVKSKEGGLNALYWLAYNEGIVVDYVGHANFMKKLAKIDFDNLYYTEKKYPVKLENDDLKIILMPMTFS